MIKTERWLTHYYENLRQMHSFLKTIYNADDYNESPRLFQEIVDDIDKKLYKAERLTMREYGK